MVDKQEMEKYRNLGFDFPKGSIIACVDLIDCLELDKKSNEEIISENNIAYGDKFRTGYAWKLENVKKIKNIDNIKGQLGLWNYNENEQEDIYEKI